MASESFTGEQIRTFRQIFTELSDPAEGGLQFEAFAATVEACLQSAGLPPPPPHYLNAEFRRLSTTGTVPWQQFFQVLIHINLDHVQGVGYQESTPPPPVPPPPVPPHSSSTSAHSSPPPATGMSNNVSRDNTPDSSAHQQASSAVGGGGRIVESSRSRVGFVDSPEIVNVSPIEENVDVMPVEVEPSSTWGQTLRRGGARLGRAVGNFFGVTEESQHGTSDQLGWARVGEMSAGETFASGRRLSFRGILQDEPPPEYPGPPSLPGVAGAHSFDPAELGDSSEEEDNNLFSAAPPDYQEVVGSGQPPAMAPSPQTVWVDVHVHEGTAGAQLHSRSSAAPLLTPQAAQQQYPPPTQPARTGDVDLIYDANDAWNYYQRFVQAERSLRQRRHHQGAFEFFGSVDAVEANIHDVEGEGGRQGTLRRDRLGSVEGQQVELRRRKKKKKSTKLQRQSTIVRHKVESLPSFIPWFIIVMSILQVAALIILISIRGGVADIHAIPIKHTDTFPSLRSNNSNATERVTYYRAVNLWIGLSPEELIEIGAKFTPCMRRDFGIQRRNTRLYGDKRDSIACCKNRDNVGSVLDVNDCACTAEGQLCSEVNVNTTGIGYNSLGSCTDIFNVSTLGLPSFHPCCVSITGLCYMTSNEECDARNGKYHSTRDSCLEVNCLEGICGFNGAYVGSDDDTPYLPAANQFWRWFLSIFIHLGVIHILIVMPIQLYIGIKIERTIGWLRVGIIYLISGVGGNILSAVFVPYGVNAGASGAVVGLIGVLFVELFQFWQIVDHAFLELLKLMGFVLFLLAVGTLPYIDNMAHIGGLLFGVVAAIIFVPYITFGKLDTFRKRILLAICAPLLLVMFVTGLLTFYLIPDSSFCEGCGYINCIPYAKDLCPDEYRNPNPEIFSL